MTKTAEDYLDLPYHILLVRDETDDGDIGWVASVSELAGCISQGDSPDEAVAQIRDAMLGWISATLQDGHTVPEPRPDEGYSGRLLLRMPRSLHATLAYHASQDDTSLNQYILAALAQHVGYQAGQKTAVA